MRRIPVNSSNIRSIGYELAPAILEVEFTSGDVYQYYDVPEHLYKEFFHASSLGGFLNDNIIKYHYRYRKVS
jgi:hypothetical protein